MQLNNLVVAGATAALASVALAAQAPPQAAQATTRPAFDVVSIKPHDDSGDNAFSSSMRTSTGRYSASNISVTNLILSAFRTPGSNIKTSEILNLPADVSSFRFDIVATTEMTREAMNAQMPALMRSLLEDRFKMVAHVETRTVPVYALVMAHSDRRLGPQLRVASDCSTQRSPAGAPVAAPSTTFTPTAVGGASTGGGMPNCNGMAMGPTRMSIRGMPMAALAVMLPLDGDRPVVNATDLTGNFDVDMEWAPTSGPGATPDGPSIFTAIQEQLGLKLEPRQALRDVIVVDHIEKPTPN